MTETDTKRLATRQVIDSIICKFTGIKILEGEKRLIVKNDKYEYIYSIEHREYNTGGRKRQKILTDLFLKSQDPSTKGEITQLHGCQYSNLKRGCLGGELISFSTRFPSFDDEKMVPESRITLGYLNTYCILKIKAKSSPVKELISYKIEPMTGLCKGAICTPRLLLCNYKDTNIIDDLEMRYNGNKMLTLELKPLEEQLDILKPKINSLEPPIEKPEVGDVCRTT
jgi:hypothetical protein